MAELQTAQYLKQLLQRKSHHPEIEFPIPQLNSDESFGDMGFTTYYEHITKPFTHAPKSHVHDFPQFLIFLGERENMMEIDAEIELNLSLDGKNMEKHSITKATSIFIPPGLWHGPLIYHKVNKPFMFIDLYFAEHYGRSYDKKGDK
jgi:hypothetical protein